MSVLGAMLKTRAAMGRVQEATRQWCSAFDKGDMDEIGILAPLVAEAMTDVAEAISELVSIAPKAKP